MSDTGSGRVFVCVLTPLAKAINLSALGADLAIHFRKPVP
jgi:hypothetical protein